MLQFFLWTELLKINNFFSFSNRKKEIIYYQECFVALGGKLNLELRLVAQNAL